MQRLGAPPPEFTAAGALEELRGCSAYEDAESKVAPFDAALVSLPEAGNSPVPLAALLGDSGQREVSDFVSSVVNSSTCAQSNLSSLGLNKSYIDDTLLSDRTQYAAFVSRLRAAGLVSFRPKSQVIESVGCFFVRKRAQGQDYFSVAPLKGVRGIVRCAV